MIHTLRTIKYELGKRSKLKLINYSSLKEDEVVIMNKLEEKGYVVIENFMDREKCSRIRLEIDRLINENSDKIWKDEEGADYRAWGAENKSDIIKEFYEDEKIKRLVFAHEGHTNKCFYTTMFGRIRSKFKNAGSGGGWHRDLAEFKQTKVILYLSDVNENNGPFQYLSHSHSSIIKDQIKNGFVVNQNRFSDEQIDGMIQSDASRLKTAIGKAGTLLIANTRGIHRGKPFENGERYALTNYYWFDLKVHKTVEKHSL